MLSMTYGSYFLAELIEAQDDNMHCLVAEVRHRAWHALPCGRGETWGLACTALWPR